MKDELEENRPSGDISGDEDLGLFRAEGLEVVDAFTLREKAMQLHYRDLQLLHHPSQQRCPSVSLCQTQEQNKPDDQ